MADQIAADQIVMDQGPVAKTLPDQNKPLKQAVILSGGGANGAYEVGVLKALFSGKSPGTSPKSNPGTTLAAATGTSGEEGVELKPDIFCGTSSGSFNAAYLVAHWGDIAQGSISGLERVWSARISQSSPVGGNGLYRYLANPFAILDPEQFLSNPLGFFARFAKDSILLFQDATYRLLNLITSDDPLQERFLSLVNLDSFISRSPFEQVLQDEIPFETIGTSKHPQIRVVATSWETGKVEIFENKHFTEKLGPKIVLASSAIPAIFPPTSVGAQPYVDGGILMNTPLKPAIDADADIIHVIYLDPDVGQIPVQDLRGLLPTTYRVQVINWAARINESIPRVRFFNAMHRWKQEHGGVLPEGFREQVAQEAWDFPDNDMPNKPLTIHRYHPRDELGGGALGLLDFRRDRIRKLIDRGFFDAVNHDCYDNRCVRLGETPGQESEIRQMAEAFVSLQVAS